MAPGLCLDTEHHHNQNVPFSTLQDLLQHVANVTPSAGLIIYPRKNTATPCRLTYQDLYAKARRLMVIIQGLEGFEKGRPVLLHLSDHWNIITWFWGVLLAGGLAVLSSPFPHSAQHRLDHIKNLCEVLESPLCITKAEDVHLFGGDHTLKLNTVESLDGPVAATTANSSIPRATQNSNGVDKGQLPAVLMLTSGSTGRSKAVSLSHRQILAAVRGKASVRPLPKDRPFLNWIGLDHVAGLTEIHLQALYLGMDQIHVHAQDVVAHPRLFLDLLDRHRVCRTFAPNFFLTMLVSMLQLQESSISPSKWDLHSLIILGSGGEANDTDTCVALGDLLSGYGAPRNVIMPGFGMTETCAGAIYNLHCPEVDVRNQRSVVAVGKCMDGVEMRITLSTTTNNDETVLAAPNKPGSLEVRGDAVFKGYYRNAKATAEALTPDGWFRTGDQAYMDHDGNLNLIGRTKEVFNIGGVKIGCDYVRTTLEQALASRVRRLVAFPTRSAKHGTEQITVCFVPIAGILDMEKMVSIRNIIIRTCLELTNSSPVVFPVADESVLPMSTLGKISTAKMKSLFEQHVFAADIKRSNQMLSQYKKKQQLASGTGGPISDTEAWLLEQVVSVLGGDDETAGVNVPLLDMGFTSMNLIQLKHRIDSRFDFDVPIIAILANPTVRSLSTALHNLQRDAGSATSPSHPAVSYNPVVTLNSGGSKTPLWLIHPGVGEILVFVGLAKHLADDHRPVYALRARGFEPGQPTFSSIREAVQTYKNAILQHQPEGPYAIAGYSYGSMLAFELAKAMEAEVPGASVDFLGCFNLPPHIKTRMRYLNWNMCLLHLAYFLSLIQESEAESLEPILRGASRDATMAQVLDLADGKRIEELGLQSRDLAAWADVSYSLQSMATDYEPQGQVRCMDIFCAVPLRAVAENMDEWMDNHLGRWRDFCKTEPVFHRVGGEHYTMIGPDHVEGFARTLKLALRERGGLNQPRRGLLNGSIVT